MNNKKKVIISMVIVLLLIVVVSSATYAVYKWRSTYGLNVDITVNDNVVITFDGGPNITGRIKPVSDPSEGIIKEMSVKSNLPNNASYNLYLKINELPEGLKNTSFRWGLIDDEEVESCLSTTCNSTDLENAGHFVISGNFSTSSMNEYKDATTNDLLLLEGSSIPFKNKQELYLYLWIDGTVDNDPSMGGNSIDFDLYATGSSDTLVELPSQ